MARLGAGASGDNQLDCARPPPKGLIWDNGEFMKQIGLTN